MPGIKISQLTETTSPQATDEFVIQRGGLANYRLKLENIPLTSINVAGLAAGKPLQVNSGGTAVESASDIDVGSVTAGNVITDTITTSGDLSINSTGKVKVSTIDVGATNLSYTTITSSATAGSYTTYFINCSSGSVVLTLPSAVTYPKRIYNIVRTVNSTYNCIIAPQSGQTINGENSWSLEMAGQCVVVQSEGANWKIIGRY